MSVQVAAYGYVLTLNTGLDLSTATVVNLLIKAPASAPVTKSIPLPAGLSDAPSGKVSYQVVQGDFPVAGIYQLQVEDASPGRSVLSRVAVLVVEPNLA